MTQERIRKNDSLESTVGRLQMDMKTSHGKYSSLVDDLAYLTKNDLKGIIGKLNNELDPTVYDNFNQIFEKIENVLHDMEDIHVDMEEVVSLIGGLEFSTTSTVDKLYSILRDQESQQGRLTQEITMLKNELPSIQDNDSVEITQFKENLVEFQYEFSRFQDYIIDAVPRISKLFIELDDEEKRGVKYGSKGI
ncbi:MAG: hypothetical protein OEY49_01145 [Candidatus Heimdallarchaeota archaeon]|nr:hypothetical protein [Candidatus Heimdallarchaeota archaeon]